MSTENSSFLFLEFQNVQVLALSSEQRGFQNEPETSFCIRINPWFVTIHDGIGTNFAIEEFCVSKRVIARREVFDAVFEAFNQDFLLFCFCEFLHTTKFLILRHEP